MLPLPRKKNGVSGGDIYKDSQHPSSFAWPNVLSIEIRYICMGKETACSDVDCRPACILLLELLQSHKPRLNDDRLLAFNLAEDQLTGLGLCTLVTTYI